MDSIMEVRDFKELRHMTYPAHILNEWFRKNIHVDSETWGQLYVDLLSDKSTCVELMSWIKLIEHAELFHVYLVKEISHNLNHDHSKDGFYRLVTNARFALVDSKKPVSNELESIFLKRMSKTL